MKNWAFVFLFMSLFMVFTACGRASTPTVSETRVDNQLEDHDKEKEDRSKNSQKNSVILLAEAPLELQTIYEENKEMQGVWVKNIEGRRYILITMGIRESGGYEVEVHQEEEGNELRIEYEFITPAPGQMVTEALTYPYALLELDIDQQVHIQHLEKTILRNHNDLRIIEGVVTTETAYVVYEGSVKVKGHFRYDPDHVYLDGIAFEVAEESLALLPKLERDNRTVWFGFENDEVARKALGIEDGVLAEGEVKIEIKNYTIIYIPIETWNLATFVKKIEVNSNETKEDLQSTITEGLPNNFSKYNGDWFEQDTQFVDIESNQAHVGTFLSLSQIRENVFHFGYFEVSLPPMSRVAGFEKQVEFSPSGFTRFDFEDGWGTKGQGDIQLLENQIIVNIETQLEEGHFPDMRISNGKKIFIKGE